MTPFAPHQSELEKVKAEHTPGPRYKVEHCDTRGVWVPLHRGALRSHRAALDMKQAFCRILVDYLGNGVWEEIETMHGHTEQWEAEKRAIAKATGASNV